MSTNLGIGINAHMRDETTVVTNRVASSGDDFVSLQLGGQVSILMFTPAHAKAVALAAADAYHLLKTIELEKERENMLKSMTSEARSYELDEDGECTIENPCSSCIDYNDDYEPF